MKWSEKSWLDNGFRTWKNDKTKLWLFRVDRNNLQGDMWFAVTLHLFWRAYQFCWLFTNWYDKPVKRDKDGIW